MHLKVLFCSILVAISVTISVNSQGLSFQETDTNENHQSQQHNRQPVISNKCQPGELLYPGDNNGDWACDCRPAYIYYPQTLRCYEAYTQGPCKQNEILKLPQGKFVPVCERNTCNVGQIRYENVCGKLGGYEACKQPSKGAKSFLLKVNPTTLQLNCTLPNFGSRIEINEEEGLYESDHCFIGGKRAQENTCVIHT